MFYKRDSRSKLNLSKIPVSKLDITVHGWYLGGVTALDFKSDYLGIFRAMFKVTNTGFVAGNNLMPLLLRGDPSNSSRLGWSKTKLRSCRKCKKSLLETKPKNKLWEVPTLLCVSQSPGRNCMYTLGCRDFDLFIKRTIPRWKWISN
jgi:hypothetical protein